MYIEDVMADKKISEFESFPGKQDSKTHYVVSSGDSGGPDTTNYKVSFTDLVSGISGELSGSLGGGGGGEGTPGPGGSFNFGPTNPSNNSDVINFNQGETVRMYIDENGGVNVSEKLIVSDGKETVLGGPVTVKGSTTHEGGLFTTSDTTTTLFKGPNTFGDSTSDITNFLGTTNITGPLNLKDPAFSVLTSDPDPSTGKLYRKGNDLYFDGKKLLTDGAGGGSGKWSDGTSAGQIHYSGGNVGIGTNNPSATLHIVGGTFTQEGGNAVFKGGGLVHDTSSYFVKTSGHPSTYNGNSAAVIQLQANDYALGDPLQNRDTLTRTFENHEYPDVFLITHEVNGSLVQRLEINAGGDFIVQKGKVGIGTTDVKDKLHVHGGNLRISHGDGTGCVVDQSDAWMRFKLNLEQSAGGIRSVAKGVYTSVQDRDSALEFYTSQNNTDVRRMTIDHNGNVGIGTANPSAPLDISSTTGGLIIPRMTTAQRNAITSPTRGEMVFDDTDNTFYGYDGTTWKALHS